MYNYYEGQITDIINITTITYEADTNRTGSIYYTCTIDNGVLLHYLCIYRLCETGR